MYVNQNEWNALYGLYEMLNDLCGQSDLQDLIFSFEVYSCYDLISTCGFLFSLCDKFFVDSYLHLFVV